MANGLIDLAGGNLFFTLFFHHDHFADSRYGSADDCQLCDYLYDGSPGPRSCWECPSWQPTCSSFISASSPISPRPWLLSAYAAAGSPKSNPFKTGVIASKLAIGAFIVPYIFRFPGSLSAGKPGRFAENPYRNSPSLPISKPVLPWPNPAGNSRNTPIPTPIFFTLLREREKHGWREKGSFGEKERRLLSRQARNTGTGTRGKRISC